MTARIRVFVSSVQNELEDERLIVQNLVNTDPFLSAHCAPVLYEFEPASPVKALEDCLDCLDGCHIYLVIVGAQQGTSVGDLTVTHAEGSYRTYRLTEHTPPTVDSLVELIWTTSRGMRYCGMEVAGMPPATGNFSKTVGR